MVEDEQRKTVGEDLPELLLGERELGGGQDDGAARGEERAEVLPVGDKEGGSLAGQRGPARGP